MGNLIHFSKVRKAREALKARAEEILNGYLKTIELAVKAEQFEAALKAQQWLIEHTPAEDGERMVEVSIDKPVKVEGRSGPSVQIAFALGGIPQSQKALEAAPALIVEAKEVTPDPADENPPT